MHCLGPYYILTTKINGTPHYYNLIESSRWTPNRENVYKFGFPGDARRVALRWPVYDDHKIEICFHWLPPLDGTEYSNTFWGINSNQPLTFEKFINDGFENVILTQGQVQIILPESKLIQLFGWYFELEDHNAVLEFVEKMDK